MNDLLIRWTNDIATWLERLAALTILAGVVVFTYYSSIEMMAMDWSSIETFYEFIYRLLLLIIGVELMRTLVTHDLNAILELLAFVVARKMLKPDISALDILLASASFVCLMAARRYLLPMFTPDSTRR